MEQFTLIGRQLNIVLEHMRNRLDGQKSFIEVTRDTVEIAQSQISQAMADKRVK